EVAEVAEESTEVVEEAAPRSRRSRSATSRSRAARTVVEPEPEPEAAPEDDEDDESVTSEAPTLDVIAELGRPVEAQRSAEDRPRLASTAVLFQAPDPADRPRRRRAQAPAGPPQEPEAGPETEAEAEAESAEVPAESAQPAGSRSGRGRSGRRRGRAAETDTAEEVEGSPEISGPAAEATSDDQAETAADENEEPGESGEGGNARRRRRRGGRGRRRPAAGEEQDENDESDESATDEDAEGAGTADGPDEAEGAQDAEGESGDEGSSSSRRRRRRRSRSGRSEAPVEETSRTRSRGARASDEVTALKGSTRLEAKRQRRREGRDAGRRRAIITEAEFLARREAVERSMVVKEANGRVQIAVLEDGVLVEHFVSRSAQNGQSSMSGNVYLGRVQNVLPSMEAAFVDIGKGRNAVLYAGEVNWDAAGLEGQPRRIEQALKSGDSVLVQVTKDPIGHKGARLTSQITLAGRYLVYVPGGGMTGISRKLPENERARLKKLLKEIVPEAAGVIVRTAAEGASEDELRRDVQRLQDQWAAIEKKAKSGQAPVMLQGEPDLAIRVVRDIFNDDFGSLVVQGDGAWSMISEYVQAMAPDLAEKVSKWTGTGDVFAAHRVDEQLAKGMDRKVWLPSGGSLVIDRTEAMTVVDVNTGKFTGSGGTLEETVTRNNLEAAEEIVRQLRLRDIGGIIVIDFIDMVLESNRDLVLRRLVECLGRDRTKHQVAEVTSLGLVQMTRKRVGQGLVEAFSETCQHCAGRGFIVHTDPIDARPTEQDDAGDGEGSGGSADSKRSRRRKAAAPSPAVPVLPEARDAVKATLATIAAAAAHAHDHEHAHAAPVTQEAPQAEPAPVAEADEQDGAQQAPGASDEVVGATQDPSGEAPDVTQDTSGEAPDVTQDTSGEAPEEALVAAGGDEEVVPET
ncbi:Rne/Rng family ribonuclease, partial [Actinotalea sp.]|uniref:Rne/Rng family ribonuclease n=1 Tax=Actinotalea sp. TaxID=1872145 RepID=UPI0035698D4B